MQTELAFDFLILLNDWEACRRCFIFGVVRAIALQSPAMAALPIIFPPPLWSNQDIVLYHGTIDAHATAIVASVRVSLGKPYTDFGAGFYTTTLRRQAHTWAAQIAATKSPVTAPAVIQITVAREDLARLQTLAFVRGDFHADDYWSFVHYCRAGALDHNRPHPFGYYDVVYGPVAAFWNQRMIIADADQIRFHTVAGEAVLNKSARVRVL